MNPSGALSSASQLSSSQDSLDDIVITNNFTTSSESLVSTATNGFAFIKPTNYEHTNGIKTKVWHFLSYIVLKFKLTSFQISETNFRSQSRGNQLIIETN